VAGIDRLHVSDKADTVWVADLRKAAAREPRPSRSASSRTRFAVGDLCGNAVRGARLAHGLRFVLKGSVVYLRRTSDRAAADGPGVAH